MQLERANQIAVVLHPEGHMQVAVILLRRPEDQEIAHDLGHHRPDIRLLLPQDVGELSGYPGQYLSDDLLLLPPFRENALAAEVAAQLPGHLFQTQVDLRQDLRHVGHSILAL